MLNNICIFYVLVFISYRCYPMSAFASENLSDLTLGLFFGVKS